MRTIFRVLLFSIQPEFNTLYLQYSGQTLTNRLFREKKFGKIILQVFHIQTQYRIFHF